MKYPIEQVFSQFLHKYMDPARPLLLGLSGGPDSLALFYLLLKFRKQGSLSFAVAHIDHGWREESAVEAERLKELAEHFEIPFHLKKLGVKPEKNLEAIGRQERLSFFAELVRQHGYQAVLLGHHADDRAETVLKRVLEGADLCYLTGLQEEILMDGVKLWRLLLSFSKKEVATWLSEVEGAMEPIFDWTNLDAKFLRGRLREEILPSLSRSFGKEVAKNLCQLGKEAQELKGYLDTKLEKYILSGVRGRFGVLLDLGGEVVLHPFEVKYVVKEFCRREGIVLSKECLETACELVMSSKGNKDVQMGTYTLHIDRRRLFLMKQIVAELSGSSVVQEGVFSYGVWNVRVECVDRPMRAVTGWRAVWNGGVEITLPHGEYSLGSIALHSASSEQKAAISKKWTHGKVPAILRHVVPLVWHGGEAYHEFLTESVKGKALEQTGRWLRLRLDLK